MAKIRIRWRHIWRNFGAVLFMVRELMDTWPAVKVGLETASRNSSAVDRFYRAADDLYQTIARRK